METSHFLQDVVMYLAAAVVAVSLSRRWGLGAVLGYLAAGALIGPYALNLARDVEATSELSEFGVILLLFVIGLELSPQRLWLMRRAVSRAGLAQVVLSGLLLGAAALGSAWWKSALVVGLHWPCRRPRLVCRLRRNTQLNSPHGAWHSRFCCSRIWQPSRSSR
jgi:glutathione-regulated potassium-efflux system protein KefB